MDAPTLNGINVPKWKCWSPLKRMGASTMKITTVSRPRPSVLPKAVVRYASTGRLSVDAAADPTGRPAHSD